MDNPIYLIDRANWNGGTTSVLNPQTYCSVFNPDKTMAMLIEEYRMDDPDIITIDELIELYDGLRTSWKEKTEKEFYELFECLPPMKVYNETMEDGTKLFGYMCPEADVAHLHCHGLRVTRNEKIVYLYAIKSQFDQWDKLAKEALECLTKQE